MLKLQYFGHLMRRANSLEKTLMLGKIEGRRRRRWQSMRWLDGITDSKDMSLKCCSSWGCKESDMAERLNNNRRKKLCDEFCLWEPESYFRKCLKVFEKAAYLACLQLSSFQASSEVLFSFEFYPSFDKKRIKKKRKTLRSAFSLVA